MKQCAVRYVPQVYNSTELYPKLIVGALVKGIVLQVTVQFDSVVEK